MTPLEQITRVAYEAYAAAMLAHAIEVPAYDKLPRDMQEAELGSVNYFRTSPMANETSMHTDWMLHMQEEGWSYAPDLDEEKKTTPMLVLFSDLPPFAQLHDHIFYAVCRILLPAMQEDDLDAE
jgi:hypothetical protein